MHESLQPVCKKIGVKKAWQRILGLGKLALRKSDREPIFSLNAQCRSLFWKPGMWTYTKHWTRDRVAHAAPNKGHKMKKNTVDQRL